MMNRSPLNVGLALIFTATLLAACSRSDSRSSQPPAAGDEGKSTATQNAPAPLVAKFHWLGKARLASEANATNFMAIWGSPASAKLEAQTLDKLATAPWRLLHAAAPLSNAPVALFRPLLNDLIQAESYLEVRAATNQPGEMAFAIRLAASRAALWQSNLPIVLKSIFRIPTPDSKSEAQNGNFQLQTSGFRLELTRAGDWVLLSRSDSRLPAPDLRILADFQSRIQRAGTPCAAPASNAWMEVEVDAPALSEALQLDWKLPATFPRIDLVLTGDGKNVRTRGGLDFPQPLPESLSPWRVPFELTAEPLIGLTAVRSLAPVLEQMGVLTGNQAKLFPDQFLVWLRSGPPLQIHFAFPVESATNTFWQLAPLITDWVNSHANARLYGAIALETNRSELKWNGLSLCAPYMKTGTNLGSQYLQGGFGFMPLKIRLPTELQEHIRGETNLLYFDWEFAAETLPQWRYLDDVSRMIFDAAHASRLRSAKQSLSWLALNVTNLSHSVTEVHQTSPHELLLTRKSTLGLSAVELDILINWIEMPEFPAGLASLWRTNPAPLLWHHQTTAPSAPLKAR